MSIEDKLKNIAIEDFANFLVLMGRDNLNIVKARILRNEGKSLNQIALKLGMTISQVRTAVKK